MKFIRCGASEINDMRYRVYKHCPIGGLYGVGICIEHASGT